MRRVSVAIPNSFVQGTLDYLVPGDIKGDIFIGARVLVPLGKRKLIGIIIDISDQTETPLPGIKVLEEIIDEQPLLSGDSIKLCKWVSEYYFNALGDVCKSALPPGMMLEPQDSLRITEKGRRFLREFSINALHTERETSLFSVADLVRERSSIPVKAALSETGSANLNLALKENLVEVFENIKDKALSLIRKGVIALPGKDDSDLGPAHRQQQLYRLLEKQTQPLLLTELASRHSYSSSVIKALVDKGFAEYVDVEIRRDPFADIHTDQADPHPLTKDQLEIFEEIAEPIGSGVFSPFLLHGVTGSGKTEIYLHLIQRALERGGRALVLIPEISLTPQFARRFYQVFGDSLAILHSGLSGGQRLDEWFRIQRGEASVVLGTRLSVFSPIENLMMIIVDEEHDQSYKQEERVVFHARDLAVKRAADSGAVCLLGSATPSSESYVNAGKGKYRLLKLRKRIFDRPLPTIEKVDLRIAEKASEDQLLPDIVEEHLENTLSLGEQTMVLVGRKGHAPFVLCRACGHSFECPGCAISLSWHEIIEKLKCHFCGRLSALPSFCPECGSPSIEKFGMGTAKVEDYLKQRFAGARIARMDRDVIRRAVDYSNTLSALNRGDIDILVGTQMLAKGHDYPNVTTVVTLGIDSILRLPDFRHSERVFQLLTQVSGRAGRGEKPGRVFICTYKPNHFAIEAAANQDFDSFFDTELEYRRALRYPPHGFMTLLTIEHYRKHDALATATSVLEKLNANLDKSAIVLGPALAPYARLNNKWRYQLIIKSLDRVKTRHALHGIRRGLKNPKEIKIIVDPLSVM